MNSFHNDIFNRRSSNAFINDFRQDNRSGVFAPPAMPKPLFCDSDGHQAMRRSSFSGDMGHRHFAYVAGCEICEEYVRRGAEICHHEHRVVCRGIHHGCCCHNCSRTREITVEATITTGGGNSHSHGHNHNHSQNHNSNGFKARTEESVSDSAFGNGRVRARSATTMVGDSSFGFANMDSEMLRMASDNQWRFSKNTQDSFYGRPFSSHCDAPPAGHVQLNERNAAKVFESHRMMHGDRQSQMHADAAAHFNGYSRPQPLFGAAYGCSKQEEEESEVKVTTTTTTTTTTKHFEHDCPPPCPPVPRPCTPPPPVVVVPHPPPVVHHHHHDHDHDHGPVIPVGTKPGVLVKRAEPCCTWCKFLPCLSCPKPSNPNERFKKANFRLFPEYEFLPDNLDVPKPTEYFPEHTHFASRSEYKVTIPKVTQISQRVYVDFIGDQMVVIGEHGKPMGHLPRHMRSSPSINSTRSTLNSRETAHVRHFVPDHEKLPLGVSRVFVKNFFLPRDTYDRNRAQAFIKPNGKLKIVVPVLAV
ncbi:hypothetical protein GGI07_003706 [Coemansia sp. Benny D115]|nr:hypothetical protein GGI07_003706 [Coemansia sp. Benny D115]